MKSDWALKAAEEIADDIQGRQGLGNEWEQIDEDDRKQITDEWADIIARAQDRYGR